jgi:hypothetical protein
MIRLVLFSQIVLSMQKLSEVQSVSVFHGDGCSIEKCLSAPKSKKCQKVQQCGNGEKLSHRGLDNFAQSCGT